VGDFTEEDELLLRQLASIASLALENARLFEAEQADLVRATVLAETASLLASSLDVRTVMPEVLSVASRTLRGCGGLLALRERDGWRVDSVSGLPEGLLGEFHADGDSPTMARVRETREPFFVKDVKDAEAVIRDQAERLGYRSFVSHPVQYRDEVVAVLSFCPPGAGAQVASVETSAAALLGPMMPAFEFVGVLLLAALAAALAIVDGGDDR